MTNLKLIIKMYGICLMLPFLGLYASYKSPRQFNKYHRLFWQYRSQLTGRFTQ